MSHKNKTNHQNIVRRKALVFERTLHSWELWIDSIIEGRKVLRDVSSYPSLQEMRAAASKTLNELNFNQCTLFELYWLCCVFSDYDTLYGFKFEKLILPDWFPLPFGFEDEEYIDKKSLNLNGGRICPPQVLNEAEVKFWRGNNPLARATGWPVESIPHKDWVIVLSPDHPVRQHVKHGRPCKSLPNGEVRIPHKAMKKIMDVDDYRITKNPLAPKPPKICGHCGATALIWDGADNVYKCMLCRRVTVPIPVGHPQLD